MWDGGRVHAIKAHVACAAAMAPDDRDLLEQELTGTVPSPPPASARFAP
jgi:hypothetical protein